MKPIKGWLPLLLAVCASVAAVVLALTPAGSSQREITWEPATWQDSGTLKLTRGAPESLTGTTTCERIRAVEDEAEPLLTAGTLTLARTTNTLALTAHPDSAGVEAALPSGDCNVRFTYQLDPGTLTLSVDGDSHTAKTQQPTVTGLRTIGDPAAIERLTIETQSVSLEPTASRLALLAVALTLVGVVLMLLQRSDRQGRERREGTHRSRRRLRLPRPAPVDVAVTAAMSFFAVTVPAQFDEGWTLARTQQLAERHWFGNIFFTRDAWLPQGLPHEALYATLGQLGWGLVHLRLLVALMLVIAWVVLRRFVLEPVLGRRASRWPPVAAAYVMFAVAWLLTLRQEPVVALFTILALAAWQSSDRRARPTVVALGLMAAGMAMASHQTGWVALGPALMLAWAGLRTARRDPSSRPGLAAAAIVSGAFVLAVFFAVADLATLLSAFGDLTSDAAYQDGAFAELQRYQQLFSGDTASVRVFAALATFVIGITAAPLVGTREQPQRRLWTAAILIFPGLLLTSSKLPWHFGVCIVIIVVALAYMAPDSESRPDVGVPRLALLLPSLVVLTVVTAMRPGRWGDSDLAGRTWDRFSELLTQESARPWWYVAILVSVVIGVLWDSGRLRRTGTVAATVMVLAPLLASMTWVLLDATDSGWSFQGSNVRQLAGNDPCGVLSDRPVLAGAEELPLDPDEDQVPGRQALTLDGFPRQQGLSTGPFDDAVGVWGSWAQDRGEASADARTGELRGPEYRLDGVETVTLWSSAGATEDLSASVVFSDSADREVETVDLPLAAETMWNLHRVPVPDEAVGVHLVIQDASIVFGGWAAVSTPALGIDPVAQEVFSDHTAYVSPFVATHLQCARLPDLSDGYWQRLDYVYYPDFFYQPEELSQLTTTEALCLPSGNCMYAIDYAMPPITVRDVTD